MCVYACQYMYINREIQLQHVYYHQIYSSPIYCFILFVNRYHISIITFISSLPPIIIFFFFCSFQLCNKSNSCFLCENVDFRPVNISKSQVGDLKCDCCDGSDEKPNTCKNTCRSDAIHYVKNRITYKRNIQEGLEIRSSNIRRAHRRISSWKNDLKYLQQDYRRLQKLREKATKRRYLELAIERFEAEILYDAEDEEEKERGKMLSTDLLKKKMKMMYSGF